MNGGDKDFAAMKKLLASWQVEILFDLFKEEDVSIEELKMMEFSHMHFLLRNYKMGVKIRFEHHFKNWRNKIGIPLNSAEYNHLRCMCSCHNRPVIENEATEYNNNDIISTTTNTQSKRKDNEQTVFAADNLEMDDSQPPLSPQSANLENSYIKMPTNELPHLTPISVGTSPHRQVHHTDEEGDTQNALTEFLSVSLDEAPPKFPSKPTHDKCPVTLAQILQLSGSRGMSIVKFYNENKRLTNNHRVQLIQTIVEFFDDNDYHLSLNMSHHLEWEILKMFPTEKLEYYRTEKRGKLYVKFSNMKRYKRERSIKIKADTETGTPRHRRLQQHHNNHLDNSMALENVSVGNNMVNNVDNNVDSNTINNMDNNFDSNIDPAIFDTWQDAEFKVKTENADE